MLLLLGGLICHSQVITTIAGGATGHGGYWGDGGPATAAEIGYFGSVAVDSKGNVYIGDANNHRIRKVDYATRIITTVAGIGLAGFNGDSIPAMSAKLNYPGPIIFDKDDNLFFVDGNNFRIRRIDVNSGIITTVAGNGIIGSTGDGGIATMASISTGYIAFDNQGNLILVCSRKIRKVNSSGIIVTIAGTGLSGSTGEAVPAISTNLGAPRGISVDLHNNIYFGDSTSAIRKIAHSTGVLTRVAGTGDNIAMPYSGDGIPAVVCHLGTFGITVDDSGNIYNSDYANSRIQKIDTSGIIRTICGTGVSGFSGDGGAATDAQISYPEYVALDKCGNVYIADFNNRRVRKITYRECDYTSVQDAPVAQKQIEITPSPAKSAITITSESFIHTLAIYNLLGQVVLQQTGSGKPQQQIDVSALPPGVYVVRVNEVWTVRLVKE